MLKENLLSTPWTILKGKYNYTTEVDTDTLPTGRTYHTPDGSYPSITTILGKTSTNLKAQMGFFIFKTKKKGPIISKMSMIGYHN